MKIYSARHQQDSRKNSKQSGIVAIDNCFALFGARQYGATTRESSDEKYPPTLILSPDPELSTPTESRHTMCLLGGKSPSVKHCSILLAEFNIYIIIFADQVFIDPTFFSIFVCGPLQSLVVNG